MSTRCVRHARLDACLARLARRPTQFRSRALRLCSALDAGGYELEISNSSAWRETAGAPRVTVENQFRSEVANLRTLDREAEVRLAMRIEFAKLRLDRALRHWSPDSEEPPADSGADPLVRRRRLEWHALRLEMVERNLYLVPITARRYRHTSADRSDLIQAGAAALFKAVDGFDWRRGVLFRTYAAYWLHEAFRSHLYNFNSTVRLPVYVQKSIKKVDAAIGRLGDPHASVEDVARAAGLSRGLVASASAAGRRTRSLDAPLDAFDPSRTLAEALAQQESGRSGDFSFEDVSVTTDVGAALERLNERERLVVRMRFGIGYERGHIYAEVAEELGVSLERVRQILVRAMAKMRTPRLRRTFEFMVT